MSEPKVSGVRSIELGVSDLKASTSFYTAAWGLQLVSAEGDSVYLRATGPEHHVVTLRQRPQRSMLNVHFAVADRAAVDALHGKAKAYGVNVLSAPEPLPAGSGGGYGFSFRTPDGQPLSISANVAQHADTIPESGKPKNLTHVVINSADVPQQTAFFTDVLGFRLSDSTDMMEFIRCGRDHHSIAVARSSGPSLNHMAFEMYDLNGLMLGSGRMRSRGFEIEWGVGRHGPGNNIFSYFIEPNGFVAEYTTGMEQVDESTFEPHDAEYWRNFPLRPCRWGMAMRPSDRIRSAFDGNLPPPAEDESRCDDVIARKFA